MSFLSASKRTFKKVGKNVGKASLRLVDPFGVTNNLFKGKIHLS